MIRRTALLLLVLTASCDLHKGHSPLPPGPAIPDLSCTVLTPAGPQAGTVSITYTLIHPAAAACAIAVDYSLDSGATFTHATTAPGGEGSSDLASSAFPGTTHLFTWNSLLDAAATAAPLTTVQVRITPLTATAVGIAATTASFTLDNSTNTAPVASYGGPLGAVDGVVVLPYTLTDAESNPVSITVEFSINSGGAFSPATDGPGGDGRTGLVSSGGGTAHTWAWNSVADGVASGGAVATVQIRITPTDGTAGLPAATVDFSVDNSANTSGTPLTSFGTAGVALADATGGNDAAPALASDGRFVYVAGNDNAADSSWRIRKFDPVTGALDAGFGTAGEVVSNPAGGFDRVTDLVTDGTSLYVVGLQEAAPFGAPFVQVWRVEKRAVGNGGLVATFGAGGVLVSDPVGDSPKVVAVLAGAGLILAGTEELNGDLQSRIERHLTLNGQLDANFGFTGVVTENVNADGDGINGIASDGMSFYTAGFQDQSANSKVRIVKRDVSSGGAGGGFGSNGAVVFDAGTGEDAGKAVAVDGSYLYVLSTTEVTSGPTAGNRTWRIDKRSTASGGIFQSGVSTGFVTHSSSSGAVALVGADLYVAGPDGAAADEQWRIERRNTLDLSLATSFGASGVLTPNPSGGTDTVERLVAANGVLYAAGQDSSSVDQEWRIEARWR